MVEEDVANTNDVGRTIVVDFLLVSDEPMVEEKVNENGIGQNLVKAFMEKMEADLEDEAGTAHNKDFTDYGKPIEEVANSERVNIESERKEWRKKPSEVQSTKKEVC